MLTQSPMKKILFALTLFALATSIQASDAIIVVNQSSELTSIEKSTLKNILSGKERYWSNGKLIDLAIPKDKALAGNVTQTYAGMSKSRFDTHWRRLVFSGRAKSLEEPASDSDMIQFVSESTNALGFISAGSEATSVKVLKITD